MILISIKNAYVAHIYIEELLDQVLTLLFCELIVMPNYFKCHMYLIMIQYSAVNLTLCRVQNASDVSY